MCASKRTIPFGIDAIADHSKNCHYSRSMVEVEPLTWEQQPYY
ncbi:hypothetical protein [Crocosphaera sp. Alani8]